MASLSFYVRRQVPRAVSHLVRLVTLARPSPAAAGAQLRRLHAPSRLRQGGKGPWGKSRGPEQQQVTDLDKADAQMLKKSHETGFLSWFRNGLLATGIGVIAFVQSEMGREAGYVFFILGGGCVAFGGASYVYSLFALRRLMLLSVPAVLRQVGVVGLGAFFWLFAVVLYIGHLEVEIIREEDEAEDEEECRECRERRELRRYRGSQDSGDSDSKDSNK